MMVQCMSYQSQWNITNNAIPKIHVLRIAAFSIDQKFNVSDYLIPKECVAHSIHNCPWVNIVYLTIWHWWQQLHSYSAKWPDQERIYFNARNCTISQRALRKRNLVVVWFLMKMLWQDCPFLWDVLLMPFVYCSYIESMKETWTNYMTMHFIYVGMCLGPRCWCGHSNVNKDA